MANVGKIGGLLGLMAGGGAFLPDEAEALPKPQYMLDLVAKLHNKDFTPMNFGYVNSRQAKKLQRVNPAFTEGDLKLSGRNIEKFRQKRIVENGLSPEEFVDGLNSVFHGSRARAFPNKEMGNTMLLRPDGDYFWKGVIAPHDGYSGLVTGYKYPVEKVKKELETLSDGRIPHHVPHTQRVSDPQQMRISVVESNLKPLNELALLPEGRPSPSYPHEALAGRLTTVSNNTSSVQSLPYANGFGKENFAPLAGTLTGLGLAHGMPQEPGLESPWLDPIDIILAPLGAVGTWAKALAMASAPVANWAMEQGIDGLLGMFEREYTW